MKCEENENHHTASAFLLESIDEMRNQFLPSERCGLYYLPHLQR
jgi:hypothetical protein